MTQRPRSPLHRKAIVATGVLVGVEAVVVARRRGSLLGFDTVVRCRTMHLFTTWWIPGASVKAVRLGWWRLQYCPVGQHWTLVTPVAMSKLSDELQRSVAGCHDLRVP